MQPRPSVLFLSSAKFPLKREFDAHREAAGGIAFVHRNVDPNREDLTQFLFNLLHEHHAVVTRDPTVSADLKDIMRDIRSLSKAELEAEGLSRVPTVVHLNELTRPEAAGPILNATFRNLRLQGSKRRPPG